MKAGIVCHRGSEHLCLKEVYERMGLKGETLFCGYNVIECSTYEQIARLAYSLQSATRVILHIDSGLIADITDFHEIIFHSLTQHAFVKDFFVTDMDVLIHCERIGNHSFNSSELAEAVGKGILLYGQTAGYHFHPVFKKAQLECFSYVVDGDYAFGIDFCGFDLSKRSYKVFSHQHSLKGTIAYCALLFSQMRNTDCLTIPFCQDGVVAIEATLAQTSISPHRYDQNKFVFNTYAPLLQKDIFAHDIAKERRMKVPISGFDPAFNNLQASKKNAKIAGVHKYLTLSKVDSDWLFTKYIHDKADIVICHLPTSFQYRKDSLEKIYHDYFEAVQDIVHEDSRIVVITTKPEVVLTCARQFFLFVESMDIYSHVSKVTFLRFTLNKANVNK